MTNLSSVLLLTGVTIACASALAVQHRRRQAELEDAAPPSPPVAASQLPKLDINPDEYVKLLGELMSESEHVQNFPPEFVPQESRVVAHLLKWLKPYAHVLQVEPVKFVDGRENLIIRYVSSNPSAKTISFVGSHLDVVPADRSTWARDPFKLVQEGDELYGRGTTDCLGHVALITLVMIQLAKNQPKLNNHVVSVFIASEENDSIKGVGVDGLHRAGLLDSLKLGAMLWIDASDSMPCMGTAGALQWKVTATGKRCHSGFPQNTVNPIELSQNAVTYLQKHFYRHFPPHRMEKRYKFATPSTFKPTIMTSAAGSLNQIPPSASISGDIRLTPFYDIEKVVEQMTKAAEELNKDLSVLENYRELGPSSRFHNVPGVTPKLEFEWLSLGDPHGFEGIACDIQSPSFHALNAAIQQVRGESVPFSINGSLPLVREMQRNGFDLQIIGFGLSKTYHADNEFCLLSDMIKGGEIVWNWIGMLDNGML